MVFFQRKIGWERIDAPPEPQRPSVISWDALNDKPNCVNPARPRKNGLPFPPEVILGGFLVYVHNVPARLDALLDTLVLRL
jgi:hypothetical protein